VADSLIEPSISRAVGWNKHTSVEQTRALVDPSDSAAMGGKRNGSEAVEHYVN